LSAFIVLFVGLALIFCEFYLPGGVMAIVGTLLVGTSIAVWIWDGATTTELVVFLIVVAISLIFTIRFALHSVRKTKRSGSIYLESDQEGFRSSKYEEDVMGKEGVAKSQLRPGGFVTIDGKKYAAISVVGYIEKGAKVTVVGIEGETVLVKSK